MNCGYSTGTARITPGGISFLNSYYSCSRAITGRWYEQARLNGEKDIEVIYTPDDLSKILIMPMDPNEEFDVAEILISEKIPASNLKKYFQSMQSLMAMRKTKR